MLPKVVILVAGRGRRLLPHTRACPKCLLSLGEGTILEHQLRHLSDIGFEEAVLICGFEAEKIRKAASEFRGNLQIRTVINEQYPIGDNLISLWAARCELDRSFILLNGDNVFHQGILEDLIRSEDPCCLMVSRKSCYDDDDMKVETDGNHIVRIGKGLDPRGADAESIGIGQFTPEAGDRLKECVEEIVSRNRKTESCYLDALQLMIGRGCRVNFRDAGSLPWTDIDTFEDLSFARTHMSIFSQPPAPHWLETA